MTTPRAFFKRLGELARSRKVDRDLHDEIETHLDLLADELVRRGMTRDDARAAARREFGGVDQTAEVVRDRRGFRVVDALLQDVRHAVRLLTKSPSFTVTAVLTLALGIGATTAVFSLVDAVLLRPLPYPDESRLVALNEFNVGLQPRVMTTHGTPLSTPTPLAPRPMAVSPANLVDYQARAKSFSSIAAYANIARNLTQAGTPERLLGEQVTWNYLSVLGVQPSMGRDFQPADDRPGAPLVAIITRGLWQSRFGGDSAILQRSVLLDGLPYTIIGVLPETFVPVSQFRGPDPVTFLEPIAFPAALLASHGDHEVNCVGRLRPGASLASAQADLDAITADLGRQFPQSNTNVRAMTQPLSEAIVGRVQDPLLLLMMTVGLILLIACVNVANLLILRAVARRREIAVRVALGAARRRVITSVLTESVVLSLMSAAAGILIAVFAKQLLVSMAPTSIPRLQNVALDARVLGFSLGISLVTGLLFGSLPAWQAGRAHPIDALRTTERVVAGSWVMRWRNALMVAEMALSTLLLVGAGLLVKSLMTYDSVTLGFEPQHVLAMNVTLPQRKYPTADDRLSFFEQLADRIARIPGVQSVGYANRFPLRGGWSTGIEIDGVPSPPGDMFDADAQAVSPGYFQTLGIPILRGRAMSPADRRDTEFVAVVSEAFGRKYLNGADPIGRRFRRGGSAPWITIVGVAGDVRRDGRTGTINPQMYVPAAQTRIYPVAIADVAVRYAGEIAPLRTALQSAVWDIDRDQPVTSVRTLTSILIDRAAERRFQALLFALLAGVALVLALVGMYGVVSYAVSQRTTEIGLRMALGASAGRILRLLVGRTSLLVGAGAAIGLMLAYALSQSIASLLFGVEPTDAMSYVAAAGLLGLAAIATSALAGRAATHIDPTVALRHE